MNDTPQADAAIHALALADIEFERAYAAGEIPEAEAQAHRARRAEAIAHLDKVRGTEDVAYSQFLDVLQSGASCEVLFELRNRMHPKDPLKETATQDLRAVGCYSRQSLRKAPEARG